jgi:hypothetical protein
MGTIVFTLSFLSIAEIVSEIFSIPRLSRNPVRIFLLFICITKSQKFNSFNALYIVDNISTSANKEIFPFPIISISA